MEIDLALLADAATVDAAGKLNILGIFDRISTTSFPAHHPHVSLVLRFVASLKEAGRHAVQIRLKDEEGKEIMKAEGELHIGSGPAALRGQVRIPQVLNFDRLTFPKPGRYGFDVLVDGEHHVSVPLVLDEARPRWPMARA